MSELEFHQFPYLSDNYGVLVHSPATGETACVDAGDADAAMAALAAKSWNLTHIFVTHHHADHTAGLMDLKRSTNSTVIGPAVESRPIEGLDQRVNDGDSFAFGGVHVQVLHTPGHTLDMMNYYIPSQGVLFAGDTLFTMGCGKLFEGDAETMWESLNKIMRLPGETVVYCSHEYTLENAEFAIKVDPDNEDLKQRIKKAKALRADNQPTVPSTLAEELATNPFLRASDANIKRGLALTDDSDLATFTELRIQRG